MKLDIPKNLNNTFHVNKLRLTNTDPLLNQPGNNVQPPPIQKDKKKGFMIKDIITEVKNKKEKRWKK